MINFNDHLQNFPPIPHCDSNIKPSNTDAYNGQHVSFFSRRWEEVKFKIVHNSSIRVN